MSQNEKDLLMRDLCEKLPYGVEIHVDDKIEMLEGILEGIEGINALDNTIEYGSFLVSDTEEIKPYRFPYQVCH